MNCNQVWLHFGQKCREACNSFGNDNIHRVILNLILKRNDSDVFGKRSTHFFDSSAELR